MFARLLALFLIVPVVELALLIRLGGWIGFWPTIGIIVLTGTAGSMLAKRGGVSVWRRFNERLRNGEIPGDELLDGMIILVSAALLITPGVLSDLAGIIGMIPFTRRHLRKYLSRRIQGALEKGTIQFGFGGFAPFGGPSAGGAESDRVGGQMRDGGWSTESAQSGAGAGTRPDTGGHWSGRPRDVPRHREE